MNNVRYIPVADETYASNPMIVRTGTNTNPPPTPQKAEIKAPNHPIHMNWDTLYKSNLRSPSTNWYPQSTFFL